MYTQQRQPPLEAQTHISANDMQQVVDDVSGPLYHQRQVSALDYLPPSDTNNNNSHGGYAHHYQHPAVPAEPPPSSTDIPTAPPTILQLAEFVSTMIHLLWHVRRSSVLELHSASSHGAFTTLAVNQGDAASVLKGSDTAFQNFCQQILTATQLSEAVVMLSLKYIAKLLQTSPNVQGAQGSEYRLFVVALLLANKFHDDNTFTNKTWADVSGMKLHELDIMELEFLSVLDFKLFIRKEEFDNWKTGLLTFMAQLQNATLMQEQQNQQQVIDSTLRSMGLFIPTPDPTWNSPTNNILTQHQPQYLYLSTAQPEFRAQTSNAPLPRVPLRIPSYPVYMPPPVSTTSATPSLSSSSSASTSTSATAPLPPSMTPMHAMYHPPVPPQLHQQNHTNTYVPPPSTDAKTFHSQTSANEPSPLTYPAPARTSNRTIPRNVSTSSLAALAQSNSNPYYYSHKNNDNSTKKPMATSNVGEMEVPNVQRYTNQHQQTRRHNDPYYQHSATTMSSESEQQQPLVDYYAWKSLTEKKETSQQQQQQRYTRLRSQSTPTYNRHNQQLQQQMVMCLKEKVGERERGGKPNKKTHRTL
ncbi:unnamed protein product [Absidia cylindrospora]